jgi:hypothetical protein
VANTRLALQDKHSFSNDPEQLLHELSQGSHFPFNKKVPSGQVHEELINEKP